MRENQDKAAASNAPEMWASYHAVSIGRPTHALRVLKERLICRMFASRILGMSGPIDSALELACGTASVLNEIRSRSGARVVGIDRDQGAIDRARHKYPGIDLQVGDLFNLPFERESFDLVYSVGLLEHFTREEQHRILEVHAALATRYVALMVPADSLLMNSILFLNKRILGRTGIWADEEVFSPESLRRTFPDYRFEAAADHRFGNLIMWFGWRP
jgi:SAM-dependent methyltransferase